MTASEPVSGQPSTSFRANRHLRTLFWLCYTIDKEIALRTGQPPFIADENCDLTLPPGYLEYRSRLCLSRGSTPSSMSDDPSFHPMPGDIRLSILKSKACRGLYSVEALKKSDTELLRDIRELDAEVEAWRVSVPPTFRPSLSISKNARLPPGLGLHENMERIMIHLEYHYLMAAIHRASGRCPSLPIENSSERDMLDVGVLSSLELSVEASRSTLFYLRAAVHELADEAFW